jgi:membrane dipeptidase
MGVIFFPWYLKKRTIFAGIELVADHIAYGAEKVGVEHVAVGTDCDSNIWLPRGFRDVSYFPVLTGELLKRGFSERELGLIYSGNYLRVLEATDGRFSSKK